MRGYGYKRSALLVTCQQCEGSGIEYNEPCLNCNGTGKSRRNESANISKLRGENGTDDLPTYAWPGGYPLCYVDEENNVLCPACANNNDNYSAMLIEYDIYWEDDNLYCDNCGKRIQSAYAEDEGENES